ncbi:MAG TPA: AraC family transcriptional regulator [Rubrobacter sp.]|nr:AraC family transcriptional regulator [Rubrobacter sp.]
MASGGTRRKHPMFALEPASSDAPRIGVEWLDRGHEMALSGPHGHRFLALTYFERGGGRQRIGSQLWDVSAGDFFVIAPGETHEAGELGEAQGWMVQFLADAIEPGGDPGALLSWQSNPLLYPFVRPSGGEVARFKVPAERRSEWSRRLRSMRAELRDRSPGFREALRAHLALILVDVGRLAQDVVGQMRLGDQPVLAEIFRFIEDRYAEPISTKDVARAVNLSSGYLTTLVRRRTGRTVLEWIVERRMAEARRLILETDESIERIGARVGYEDPTYFARRFRSAHKATPAAWRNANR